MIERWTKKKNKWRTTARKRNVIDREEGREGGIYFAFPPFGIHSGSRTYHQFFLFFLFLSRTEEEEWRRRYARSECRSLSSIMDGRERKMCVLCVLCYRSKNFVLRSGIMVIKLAGDLLRSPNWVIDPYEWFPNPIPSPKMSTSHLSPEIWSRVLTKEQEEEKWAWPAKNTYFGVVHYTHYHNPITRFASLSLWPLFPPLGWFFPPFWRLFQFSFSFSIPSSFQ